MSSLITEIETALAVNVKLTDDTLTVDLDDGRTISVPLSWYPRLSYGTKEQKQAFRLIGNGEGIHWEELDEDLSIIGLIAGRHSQENKVSIKKWQDKNSKSK
jgi:hypothetical protein